MSRLLGTTLGISRIQRGIEELDPDEQWSYVRESVISRLLGPNTVPVPKLDMASKCDLLSVFKKRKQLFSKPNFEYVGHITTIVQRFLLCSQGFGSPSTVYDNRELFPRFHHEQRVSGQDLNEYHVQINDAFHIGVKDVFLEQGSVRIDRKCPSLHGVKHLYIVTDVVYSSYFYFKVGTPYTLIIDMSVAKNMPVGFRYKKYKIKEDGSLLEVRSKLRWQAKDATWSFPFKVTNISIAHALETSMKQLVY